MSIRPAAVMLGLIFCSADVWAGTVTVPYAGSFDEASVAAQGGLPAGDYDTIGGPADVGLFDLVAGNNLFEGSVWTPGDSSDVFLIGIGPNQTLTGASIAFGTNLTPSNPMFAFPPPQWTLQESSTTPIIFDLPVGADYLGSPDNVSAAPFTRGQGIYSVLVGNGTFGCCYGSRYDIPVDYAMTFTVEEAAVPLPATVSLFSAAFAGLLLVSWWKQR